MKYNRTLFLYISSNAKYLLHLLLSKSSKCAVLLESNFEFYISQLYIHKKYVLPTLKEKGSTLRTFFEKISVSKVVFRSTWLLKHSHIKFTTFLQNKVTKSELFLTHSIATRHRLVSDEASFWFLIGLQS